MSPDHGNRPLNWQRTLLTPDATVADAIRNLNETSAQIVIVVSQQRELAGTLTDGDIRRGLMRGHGLDSAIEGLIQRNPLVVPPQLDRETVLRIMQANKLHQLPVVDDRRRVVGLHLWDDLLAPGERSNVMVIMAGGKGTRLRPHTENCPKPMLPVGGKPMLEHILERAISEGFREFVLAIHYLGHMVREHFADGSRWKVRISYVEETSPLGTAGALGLLNPRPSLPIVVTNGDVMTDIRFAELLDFHVRHGAAATMAVRLHEWQHPFGVVQTRGVDIIGFEEKPIARSHINAGIYVLEPRGLDVLARGEQCDMPALFARLQARSDRTIVYPMHEPWLDVGRVDDLDRARARYPS